jgi:hypothetical protein
MTYGPWTTNNVLSDNNQKMIVDASSDLDGKWVLKKKSNKSLDEFVELLRLVQKPIRHMVEFPKNSYHMFGQNESEIWFAMKRYDSHLNAEHQSLWLTLGVSGVQFLQDLHHLHRRVYMDMRNENVLVSNNKFHFADYELIDVVSPPKTRDYDLEFRWYFMARGAEPDEQLYSWKQDLVGLGYLLVQLTTTGKLTFYQECLDRRVGQRSKHTSIKNLMELRNVEIMTAANPVLKAYLAKVGALSWSSPDPPPRTFYEDLEALFNIAQREEVAVHVS